MKIFIAIVAFIGGFIITFLGVPFFIEQSISLIDGIIYSVVGAIIFTIIGFIKPKTIRIIMFPLFFILGGI